MYTPERRSINSKIRRKLLVARFAQLAGYYAVVEIYKEDIRRLRAQCNTRAAVAN